MTRDLAVLAAMWICWCALHSAMITRAATDYLKRRRPRASRFYRLFFNAVSLATLVPIVAYELSIDGTPVFKWEGPWEILRLGLLAAAAALGLEGGRRYDLLAFLGMRQVLDPGRATSGEAIGRSGTIDTAGVHRLVRHPWYLAALIVIWTRDLGAAALVTNAVLAAYLIVGTVLEERKLLGDLGDEYRSYQRNVSMLFPLKYIASKIRVVH
jgi:protein-S-isoprenylcysteine O-methyltransferase Ste14